MQINLLDDFLQDLKSSLTTEQQYTDPLSKLFCSVLNSITYTADVIQQWKNRSVRVYIHGLKYFSIVTIIYFFKHYKRLQYLCEEYKFFIKTHHVNSSDEGNLNTIIQIDPTLTQQFDLIQLNKENSLVTASIFDPLLEHYHEEQEKSCKIIINHIVKLLKTKSRRYIKER